MDGRLQSEIKIEKSIEKKLDNMPQYVKDWYANLRASRKTASTCSDYIGKVRRFLRFINDNPIKVKPKDITESVVSNYLMSVQTKKVDGDTVYTSDSYQITIWECLNNFLEYLEKRGLIRENYVKLIQKPKNHDLDRINESRIILTERDFKKILKTIENEKNETRRNRDRAIIMLLMNTGMRRTALLNIMVDDIDFTQKQLTVIDKGNKRHIYSLNDKMIDSIYEWMWSRHKFANKKNDGHLFISDHGNSMSTTALTGVIKKYTEKAIGKSISPHKLRAGYCSILYNKTHDAEFVRRAVGHANISTTQRYIVTKGDEKKRASEIMGSIL